MNIRPYINTCVNKILERREAGIRTQLISMATGLGKTVAFASMPEHAPRGSQSIVIAHREELIDQAADKMAKRNPGLSIGVEMANRRADGREDIIVGSVQTMQGKRLEKFNPAKVCWLTIDEAHHAPAKSYLDLIDHFMVNPFTTLLGFTATPNRADGVHWNEVFEEVVYHYGMLEGIEDGWLSDVHGFMLKTDTDISGVGSSNGDFKKNEMARAVNTPARNERIVKGWIQYCWPRQTIIFTEDVQHAKDLSAAFRRQNITSAAIWGDDPDRSAKLAAYRRGEIMVLLNCQILIEGFDMWQVECIIPAFPTKSQSKLIQEVGRGTRLQFDIDNLVEWRRLGRLKDTDKTNCLVMDPVDVLGRHSLATLPSLFGLSPKLDLQGQSVVAATKAIKAALGRFPQADVSGLEAISDLETYVRRAELWKIRFAEEVAGFSELQWTKRGDGQYRILLPKNDYFRIDEDLVGKFEVNGSLKELTYRSERVATLAEAVALVEKTITTNAPEHLILLGREQRWMKAPISKGQREQLIKLRVPHSEIAKMNRGAAATYITSRFNKKG